MAMRRSAAIAVAMIGVAGPATATEWIGRWGAPNCARDAVLIGLNAKELDLSTFEASCSRVSTKRQGDTYELAAQCSGEGRPVKVAFTVRVRGAELTFVRQRGMEFDPKRFIRCG